MSQKSHQNGTVPAAPRRDRFASGATVRLPLSDGDWVLVRAELSYGQQRRLATSALSGVPQALAEPGAGRGLTVDLATYDIERLVTWVVDWSFVDGDGARAELSREAIEGLNPDTAAELQAALDAHIEGLEGKKADRPGASASAATSPSARPSAGAGAS